MKSIKTQLMEALAINEAKEFNFDEFDRQVQKVDKFFKNKSKVNKWADGELGAPIERDIYKEIDNALEYLRGWQDNCEEFWGTAEDEYEKEYKTYKNEEFVSMCWDSVWSEIVDEIKGKSEAVAVIIGELWPMCTTKQFPFSLD